MRWRLYILFLSATAAFCFMLVTAVTDHGSGGSYQPPLVSATVETGDTVMAIGVAAPATARRSSGVRQALPELDPHFRPNPPQLFVPRNADPVMARREAELSNQANRGKPASRSKVKWDEHGWYREEVALVTAYCPCSKCCGTHSPGITSIGKNAWTSGLAADPLYLDYGTRVFVPGYGHSAVDDTGGAMRRHWRQNGILHIDVRMSYHYEARQWGKQYQRVRIYDE